MTAFADVHELINRATGGNSGSPEYISWGKVSRVSGAAAAAPIAGQRTSLWEYEGSPSHGAAPAGSAVYPTNATAGALQQTDPGGGRQKWLLSSLVSSTAAGTVKLYDRLAQFGGLSGTNTGAQTVNLTPTRYTSGAGNRIYVEINTAVGASSTTITAAYHNQANASKTTQAVSFGNTNFKEAQRWIELSLASGDTGVISVESGTAGAFSVVVGHPLETYCCPGLAVADRKSYLDGPKEILTGACLAFWYVATTATAPQFDGDIFACER